MPETKQRKSQAKQVVDKQNHENLVNAYLNVIKKLSTSKYEVREDETFRKLVNFKTNHAKPIHSWFNYKQGYAEELVEKIIRMADLESDDVILDPFTGVGTTQIVAQDMGFKSIGIDINPVAEFAAKVKTYTYSSEEIKEIRNIFNTRKYIKSSKIPVYDRLEAIFTTEQLKQILGIKGFYESISNKLASQFFKLAYLSIIEDVSNRVKDGNGIKISRTKAIITDVYGYFEAKVLMMIKDLKDRPSTLPDAKVLLGSMLMESTYKTLQKEKIGAIVYSPPYANCFDYCEVYKMEIWLGDFVDQYSDFKKYRNIAIRSHVNSKFDHTIRNVNDNTKVIADLISTYNLWNKNIPDMIRGYFDDMEEIIRKSYNISRDRALCAIIVANSGYKGISVPTDLLLAEIAEKVGYKIERIINARSIRASSQQTKELKESSNLMRESILILRK